MLIGLTGPAGSWKTRVAAILNSNHRFAPYAFAGIVKNILLSLGVKSDYLVRDKETPVPGFGVSARHMMQTLGTDWGRKMVSEDIWINYLEQSIRKDHARHQVIHDVRYENEADWVRANGVLVHLTREGYGIEGHSSEDGVEFKYGDSVLDNDVPLDELPGRVAELLTKLEFKG